MRPDISHPLHDTFFLELYQSANFVDRKEKVKNFNKVSINYILVHNNIVFLQMNRWRKRGITMMPLRYAIEWGCGFPYTVLVNIYATDGTVAISHGGVEVGQGINTKVKSYAYQYFNCKRLGQKQRRLSTIFAEC